MKILLTFLSVLLLFSLALSALPSLRAEAASSRINEVQTSEVVCPSSFYGRVFNGRAGQVVVIKISGYAVAKTPVRFEDNIAYYFIAVPTEGFPPGTALMFYIDHRLVGTAHLQPGTTQQLNLFFIGLPHPSVCSWWQWRLGLCKR